MNDATLQTRATLPARALTSDAFSAFGTVIERSPENRRIAINGGSCVRHHDLARPQAEAPGTLAFSLFEADATNLPVRLVELERHRLGTQAFAPFGAALRMLVVVARADVRATELGPDHLRAFVSNGRQGLQFHPGTWHSPLLSLEAGTWWVADRVAAVPDCEVVSVAGWPPVWLTGSAPGP